MVAISVHLPALGLKNWAAAPPPGMGCRANKKAGMRNAPGLTVAGPGQT
ncbi:hypothetical protein GCM10027180_34220 [Microbulbifer echini]